MASQAPEEVHDKIVSEEGAILLVDKPYARTSFFIVNRIRKAMSQSTGIKRIKTGHAGTLDPLATGLLIIATRRQTKALQNLIGLDKTYLVTIRLGITSLSFDLERPIEIVGGEEALTKEEVQSAIESFVGEQSQVPPDFSAIKQHGRPVYHKARAGIALTLAPRTIVIHEVEVVSIELPYASFRVRCSKGTYIRSIVRDLGLALGTGAILTDLCREAIGPWQLKDALTLGEVVNVIFPLSTF
jgi:tRNA pseudouridine55 synthase